MTEDELVKLFKKYKYDYREFEEVAHKRSNCPDIHALILLDSLVPEKVGIDMLSSACDDEVWLRISPKDLAAVVTKEQVLELRRCGVSMGKSPGGEENALTMLA